MARRTKRLWTGRGEAVDLFADDGTLACRFARVAQRYAMNANLIFKWLRDPRYAPEAPAEPDAACFLPVEIVDRPLHDDSGAAVGPVPAAGKIEIDTGG